MIEIDVYLFYIGWVLAFCGVIFWLLSRFIKKKDLKNEFAKYGRYQRDFSAIFLTAVLISLLVMRSNSEDRKAKPRVSSPEIEVLNRSIESLSNLLVRLPTESDLQNFNPELFQEESCGRSICRRVLRLARRVKKMGDTSESSKEYVGLKKRLEEVVAEVNEEQLKLDKFCGHNSETSFEK